MIKKRIKRAIMVLSDPKSSFKDMKSKSFEDILGDYMILLLICAGLAFGVNVVFGFIKSIYFDIFSNVEINYLNVLNYGFGIGFAMFFFYLFAGTFIVFFLSIILNPMFRKIKYYDLLKILFYALTPLILFSWFPVFVPSLIIWSIFLFLEGVSSYRSN
ncbi:MAG: hypothetical protein KKF44_05990 [Nanoarchaeota archaeon]|nr:hypothetical protein [Nanoarchaeota archaeon]